MGLKKTLIFAVCCFSLAAITATACAEIKRYTYSYDIAEVEWQLLNWTATWRNSTTPAGPFTLDRMEYSRKTRQINVYLKGDMALDTQDNLDKSIGQIVSLFSERFPPNFNQETDMIVYYDLRSETEKDKSVYIEYKEGSFSRQKSGDSSGYSTKVTIPY